MRRSVTILLAVAVGMLAVLVALVLIYQGVQRMQAIIIPPLSYDRAVYVAERADLCPGENLVYTNTLTVARPAIITSYLSWFKGRGATARPVFKAPVDVVPARVFTAPVVIGPTRRENVVPPLPAGVYEFHFGASDGMSLPATHAVSFTIRAGC